MRREINDIMYRILTLALMLISLSGCTAVKAAWAMTKSTEQFIVLEENSAIAYEAGSKALALELSGDLPGAVQTVESMQYGTFQDEVKVYVPGTLESFASYCTSEAPAACVIGNRLFVSPKLLDNKKKQSKVLLHELSHLQLSQSIGRWDFQRNVPSWFSEGLAVYVSGGGGTGSVGEQEAKEAILAGRAIVPNGSGSLLFPKTAHAFKLKPHMFYLQSGMYVAWLHDHNTVHFQQLIALLSQDRTVEDAMVGSYGFTVKEGWKRFVDEKIRT